MDGRTGLGKSGATGDESGEMGDDLDYVELFMPEPTLDQPCDLPAEGEALSQETLDSTSSYVGNKTSTSMTPDSCGAVVYVDETNDVVRFGIFYKGKWSTESVYGNVRRNYVQDQGRLPDNTIPAESRTSSSPTTLQLARCTTRPR